MLFSAQTSAERTGPRKLTEVKTPHAQQRKLINPANPTNPEKLTRRQDKRTLYQLGYGLPEPHTIYGPPVGPPPPPPVPVQPDFIPEPQPVIPLPQPPPPPVIEHHPEPLSIHPHPVHFGPGIFPSPIGEFCKCRFKTRERIISSR